MENNKKLKRKNDMHFYERDSFKKKIKIGWKINAMYNIHFCTLGLSFGNEYGYNSIAGHEYSVQSIQPTTWGKPEKSWNPAFTFNFIPTSHLMNWLLAHLTQRVRWAIVTTERPLARPSVNFSHFKLLIAM
jgi:hypothetical protein